MSVDAIVIGAGGFGRETLDVIEAWNRANPGGREISVGVIDDAPSQVNLDRLARRGVVYLGSLDELVAREPRVDSFHYFVGVGDPGIRARIGARCKELGWRAGTVIHPSASVGSDVRMCEGVIVCGGVQISTNVTLGQHVHLNPGSVIGHDTSIGNVVSVNPGAIVSGDVTIEAGALIGAGAVVLQGVTVGTSALVGANSCVTRDVPSATTVLGVPARARVDPGDKPSKPGIALSKESAGECIARD